MKGWLIYDKIGAERNKWFICHILKLCDKYGLEVTTKIISSEKDIENEVLPDFALVRTINYQLSNYLSQNNVIIFNNAETSYYANDKYNCYLLMKELGVKVMRTELLGSGSPTMKMPYIVKSCDGHGGSEVFFVDNDEKLKRAREKLSGKRSVVQQPSSTLGVDMRAYLLNGKIISAIIRYNDFDFRSNFSLGGKIKKGEVTLEQRKTIAKIYDKLKCEYVGIDFIIDNGEYVLNEIEDVVGARMLYQCESFDVADMWIKDISEKIKN